MNNFSSFLISIILAAFLIIFSIFSIQNITLVSLKFFIFQSINFPIGIILSLTFSMGILLGNILPFLFFSGTKSSEKSKKKKPTKISQEENDPLFDWD